MGINIAKLNIRDSFLRVVANPRLSLVLIYLVLIYLKLNTSGRATTLTASRSNSSKDQMDQLCAIFFQTTRNTFARINTANLNIPDLFLSLFPSRCCNSETVKSLLLIYPIFLKLNTSGRAIEFKLINSAQLSFERNERKIRLHVVVYIVRIFLCKKITLGFRRCEKCSRRYVGRKSCHFTATSPSFPRLRSLETSGETTRAETRSSIVAEIRGEGEGAGEFAQGDTRGSERAKRRGKQSRQPVVLR